MEIPKGMVIFAASSGEEEIAAAKTYIAKHGLTSNEIRLTDNKEQIYITAKINFTLKDIDDE